MVLECKGLETCVTLGLDGLEAPGPSEVWGHYVDRLRGRRWRGLTPSRTNVRISELDPHSPSWPWSRVTGSQQVEDRSVFPIHETVSTPLPGHRATQSLGGGPRGQDSNS